MWTDEIRRAISTRTGINKVSLTHDISLASMVTYLLVLDSENSANVSKNRSGSFISEETPLLLCYRKETVPFN